MARIKTTYGKKPKTSPTFAASTGFWSSPNKDSPSPKPASANTVDDLTSAIENLDVREIEKAEIRGRKKKEKRDRALQAIDGNVASPVRKVEKEKGIGAVDKKPIITQDDKATILPRTPQRVKQLLPKKKKKSDPAVQTPDSERRRRGKRNIPTIHLEDDDDIDEVIEAEVRSSTQKRRLRAMSSPEPALDIPKSTSTTATTTSSHRRSKSPSVLITPKSPPDPLTTYAKPLLRLCAHRQGRKQPTPFSLWAASLEPYFRITKIAEASYGEVYRLSLKRAQAGLSASDESVLKMIALKPPPDRRPAAGKKKKTKAQRALEEKIDGMSSVDSVAGEIRLLQRMAHVPGFTNFRDVRVLRGAPSESFARAWSEWNEGREEERRSIFPDPGRKGSYDEEQLWAVIEMQDAGTDLENLRMEDVGGVFGVWDIFWSVALALGKGEEEARFEHRDLHMGNICIRPANANRPITAPSTITDVARNLGFTGLESTIIDYTLSRAQMTHPLASPDPDESEIAYLDLEEDPAIFEGDAEEEYQYEIYRYMRSAMYLGDPLADLDERWDEAEEAGRTWVGFHPQTNLVWLHFILYEMMRQITPARGKGRGGKKNGKGESQDKKKSRRKIVIDSDDSDEEQALERMVEEKRRKLEKILRKVQALLDPEDWSESGLHSVKDLVALALEETWLDEEDVIAVPMEEEGSLLDLVKGMGLEDAKAR